jgi:hypothetical protein
MTIPYSPHTDARSSNFSQWREAGKVPAVHEVDPSCEPTVDAIRQLAVDTLHDPIFTDIRYELGNVAVTPFRIFNGHAVRDMPTTQEAIDALPGERGPITVTDAQFNVVTAMSGASRLVIALYDDEIMDNRMDLEKYYQSLGIDLNPDIYHPHGLPVISRTVGELHPDRSIPSWVERNLDSLNTGLDRIFEQVGPIQLGPLVPDTTDPSKFVS